jgi:biopolymer transport protein ExbD
MVITSARRHLPAARIFTASMADIVFLLIVFFVLTYQVTPDRVKVDLPETMSRVTIPENAALISIAPPSQGEVIRVSTGKENSLLVYSDEEIVTFATLVVASNPEHHFVIKADREVSYKRVDTVLDALKRARAKVIFLLSDQRTIDE